MVNRYIFSLGKVIFCVYFLFAICEASTNIGFLSDGDSSLIAASYIDIANFLSKIDDKLSENSLVVFNTTYKKNGFNFDDALKYFDDNKVTHIFTYVIFENFTEINLKLVKSKKILWTTTPQLFEACHSNIMYYGSFRRYAERSDDHAASKYIAVLYQEKHPYSGYVNYLKDFLPVVGGNLIELPPLEPNDDRISNDTIKILKKANEKVNLVILADPETTEAILTHYTTPSDVSLEFYVMELYNFNYYDSDIIKVHHVTYLSFYNVLYNPSPSLEDLVFFKLNVLFEVFLYAYRKTLSDSVPNLFYVLYDNSIDVSISNNDAISIFVSHINTISTDVYISYEDGTVETIKRDELFTYNYYYGRPRKITCSFQSPKVKSVEQYDVVLLVYVTGPYAIKDMYITETVIQAMREMINFNNFGIKILPMLIDGNGDVARIVTTFNYIFTTYRMEDRNELLNQLSIQKLTNVQVIAMKYSSGSECKEKLINTAISTTAKISKAFTTILRENTYPIVIISSSLEYGKSTAKQWKEELMENGITNIVEYEMIECTNAEAMTAISVFRSVVYPYGIAYDSITSDDEMNNEMDINAFGYGILCVEEEYLDLIIKAVNTLKINSLYRLIIPDFDQSIFLGSENKYPYKFYTFSYYVNEQQGNLIELKEKINGYYSSNEGSISNDQITAYNTIYLFKEWIQNALSTKYEYIQKQIVGTYVNTVNGPFGITESGYAINGFNIVMGTKYNDSIAFRGMFSMNSKTFGSFRTYVMIENTNQMCDYSGYVFNNNIKGSSKMYKLIVLLPSKHEYQKIFSHLAEVAIASCDFLNIQGGLLNGIVRPVFPKYEKSLDEIKKDLTDYAKDESVFAFIGVISYKNSYYFI